MATRLYLPNSGTISAGFVPNANPDAVTYSYWDTAGTISRFPAASTKGTDTKSTLSTTITTADGNAFYVRAIWATDPVASGVTLNVSGLGTLNGRIRGATSAPTGYGESVLARYSAGVYTPFAYGTFTASTSATLTNRRLILNYLSSDFTLSAGDRIVIYTAFGNDAGTAQTYSLRVGSDAGSDLPEDTVTTTDLNPWIELSENVVFGSASTGTNKIMFSSSTRMYRR